MFQSLTLTLEPVPSEFLHAYALSLADRIVLKELGGQRVAADCVVLPAGAGQAFVFRYGCVAFFNASAEDQQALLRSLEGTLRDPVAHPETESAKLPVVCERVKTAERELLLPNRELE